MLREADVCRLREMMYETTMRIVKRLDQDQNNRHFADGILKRKF